MKLKIFSLLVFVFAGVAAQAQWIPQNPILEAKKADNGVLFTMQQGTLKLQVCSPSIVRGLFRVSDGFPRPQTVVLRDHWPVDWRMDSSADSITLFTRQLKVTVTRKDGSI